MTQKTITIALILLSVSLNALAQILLRWAVRSGFGAGSGVVGKVALAAFRPGIIGGLACYAISVVVWIYVLSRSEVSFAYPFLGLGFIFVAGASALLLGEPPSTAQVIGAVIVGAGVLVIARG